MQTVQKKLYFIAGFVATDAEKAEAQTLGISAMRNVSKVSATLEHADVVAGSFPEGYRHRRGCKIIERAKSPQK